MMPLACGAFVVGCTSGHDGSADEGDASVPDAAMLFVIQSNEPVPPPPVVEEIDAGPSVPVASLPRAPSVCPAEMAHVDGYCIDKWEAYVVELDPRGHEHPHSPYATVDGLAVRAKSAPNVIPQGYISQIQAENACKNAGKRLCVREEFEKACRGPERRTYPYGASYQHGACNEGHGSMVPKYYGDSPHRWTYANFNDPRLNREGNLAKTGTFRKCVSPYGVYDLVGNLHEWGADPPDERGRGRFRGGWYGDAEVNGHGCSYVTKAHENWYHDYSTGFRCCADAKE